MSSHLPGWIAQLIARELQGFERELALFPDEASVWRTAPGVANSAGTLTLHICGNLQHFIGRQVGGSHYVRDRDAEFSRRDVPRTALLAELQTTASVVSSALAGLSADQLDEPYPETVGGVTMSTGLFLTHLVSHLGFHLGQAGYLRRMLTGDNRSAGPLPLKALAS